MISLPLINDPLRPAFEAELLNWRQRIKEIFVSPEHPLVRDDIIRLAEEIAGGQRLQETLPPEFDLLLRSLQNDVHLSFMGRVSAKHGLARNIANRIQIAALLKQHPEIREQKIVRPLIVTGFPRTGTTLLHRLLSLYHGARVPLYWELQYPAPPATPENYATHPRLLDMQRNVAQHGGMFSSMRKVHHTDPTTPEECLFLFENSFASISFSLNGYLREYFDWYFNADMRPHYEYYRLQLQILQWGMPGHPWVLKSPMHAWHLDALLDVFPDACVVQTHRAPESFLPSVCSLKGTFQRIVSHGVDCRRIGEAELIFCKHAIDKMLDVRKRYSPDSFHDVRYGDLMRDPHGCVNSILDHFGYAADSALPKKLSDYLADNQQHKFGAHKYSLQQFGLNKSTVDELFADYNKRFLVA